MYKVWLKARHRATMEMVGLLLLGKHIDYKSAERQIEGLRLTRNVPPPVQPAPGYVPMPQVPISEAQAAIYNAIDTWPVEAILSTEIEHPEHAAAYGVLEALVSQNIKLLAESDKQDVLRERVRDFTTRFKDLSELVK